MKYDDIPVTQVTTSRLKAQEPAGDRTVRDCAVERVGRVRLPGPSAAYIPETRPAIR